MPTKQSQSQSELTKHLEDHFKFLQASADAFDNGFDGEAKRLAVSIRVLVHDTTHSKSLLRQLGQKTHSFLDSAFPITQGNPCAHSGLTMTFLSPSKISRHLAFLDDIPHNHSRVTDFDSWWNATVFIDFEGEKLSRKDLVLAIANQDGGAHVDPSLNQTYANLSRNNSLGWWVVSPEEDDMQPLEGPERAAVRQIAHELLKSFITDYTKLPVYPADGLVIGGIRLS